MNIKGILREPLVHFLCAGAAIFVIGGAMEGGGADDRTIRIDKDDLLVFLQGRAQVYDKPAFAALLDDMSDDDRKRLVRDAALQEALYREGQSLQLTSADPLVRQRVVQQMRMIVLDEAAADMQVSDDEVRRYFDAHREDYAVEPRISFAHVFVAGDNGGQRALKIWDALRSGDVPFERAGEFGDRFLYQTNYTDADTETVASHFGDDFAAKAFGFTPGSWQRPIASRHGWHIVLPIRVNKAHPGAFAEVAEKVRLDALAEKRRKAEALALDEMLDSYRIETGGDLSA